MLGVLGWNDGTEQEIFSMEELISKFSVERIHKAGAKFDFEKAKWFNHEWIKNTADEELLPKIKAVLTENSVTDGQFSDQYVLEIISLVKERLTFVEDFWEQANFFFTAPKNFDVSAIKPKWSAEKTQFFNEVVADFSGLTDWNAPVLESQLKNKINEAGLKIGEFMMPLRIMLVGGKFGPDVFQIVEKLGKQEVISRIQYGLDLLN